ncbi:DinB family protein [Candidatus Bathyarchaeota archaeon]|nr:DinB family protein [Candidatus Bathyarchaeota archaeon]
MVDLSQKSIVLKELAEVAFKGLEDQLKGLDEDEMYWKPTDESNNIDWIINHICRISNTTLPRIIKGDPTYKPVGWPDDYRDRQHSIEKYVADLASGKKMVIDGIAALSDAQLEEEIPLWGGKRKRKEGLYTYIGEVIHHRGQIAFIRGTVKRKKEKDPNFLC